MSYKVIMIYLLLITSAVKPDCVSPVAGENQWRLIYRIGACLDRFGSVIDNVDGQLVSINDQLLSAIDSCCSNNSGLLVSVSESISSQLSVLDSTIFSVSDVLLSAIDACCSNNTSLLLSVSDSLSSQISIVDVDVLSIGDELQSAIESCCSTNSNLITSVSDTILSAIDAIDISGGSCCDNTDLLLSISDAISSQISVLETEFTSIIETINTTSCSPLINFNGGCDANRIDYIALEFNYGLPGDQVASGVSGTGGVVEFTSDVRLVTPVALDSVFVSTLRMVPVNPGDEVYGIFGVLFNRITAVSTQWIGLFDTFNGMAVGYPAAANAPFSILYRNASVDTVVNQAAFNVDPLDGTGPSGFVYAPTNFNTFRISSVWYGTDLIRYQILGTDGEWITFHQISNVNTQTTAALSNPYLPMRMEQIATVDTADNLASTAWRGGVIHSGDNNAGTRTFAYNRSVLAALLTGELHMFTIRNKTVFGGEVNRVLVRLARVGGGNGINNVTPVILRYYKNAAVAGPAYSDVNAINSVVEVTTTGTVSGGHLLWMTGSPIDFELTPTESMEFYLGPGETITVTAEQLAGIAGLALYATAVWEELQ